VILKVREDLKVIGRRLNEVKVDEGVIGVSFE
jgi:hypothetical protein